MPPRTITTTDPDSVLAVVRRMVPSVPKRVARRVIHLALQRPAHVEIMRVLLSGPATAREVSEALSWTHSRTARDLRVLENEGLVLRTMRCDRQPSVPTEADLWELAL